ncbi:hypothetical protein CRG98_039946 [Punica granatum]|uniref:Uncharacterized protein n=1 Tax=Punica granatum TaxID=22663 RepID=A0A2I0I6R3_PUNGR|nr:hypothetical protein CRG98_039946 [Punica granatum]
MSVLATNLEHAINRDPNFVPNFPPNPWGPRSGQFKTLSTKRPPLSLPGVSKESGATGLASKFRRETPWAIQVNPTGLEPNDHHNHLQGSVRSREPLALPQNSIRRYRGEVRPENCPVEPIFQTYSVFRDLCKAIRVNSLGLEPNNHHSHLRGSLRSREPLTLHQNSIGSHRGDLRSENCPIESRQLPAGSIVTIRVNLSGPFGFRGYFGHFDQIILDLPRPALVAVS